MSATKAVVPALSELSLYQPPVQSAIKIVAVKFLDLLEWLFTGWQLYRLLCARGRSPCWGVQLRSEGKRLCTCSSLKEKPVFHAKAPAAQWVGASSALLEPAGVEGLYQPLLAYA